jgi:hypothetical protein
MKIRNFFKDVGSAFKETPITVRELFMSSENIMRARQKELLQEMIAKGDSSDGLVIGNKLDKNGSPYRNYSADGTTFWQHKVNLSIMRQQLKDLDKSPEQLKEEWNKLDKKLFTTAWDLDRKLKTDKIFGAIRKDGYYDPAVHLEKNN